MRQVFTREHIVWAFGFWAGVLMFAATHTGLIPPQYVPQAHDAATLLAFMGKLAQSDLPSQIVP